MTDENHEIIIKLSNLRKTVKMKASGSIILTFVCILSANANLGAKGEQIVSLSKRLESESGNYTQVSMLNEFSASKDTKTHSFNYFTG